MIHRVPRTLSIFSWNIGNPSLLRATRQGEWLRKRIEDVFVLSETKDSDGCRFLEQYFRAYGYHVLFPKPRENGYGVMIVSRQPVAESGFAQHSDFLPERVVAAHVPLGEETLEIIGVYVPSRDASPQKISRKKVFLEH